MADDTNRSSLTRTDSALPAVGATAARSERWAALDLFELMWRNRGFLGKFVGAIVLGTIIFVVLKPNEYESTATLLPVGESSPLRALGSIKSLLSMSNALSGVDEASSILFPKILKSRSICEPVIAKSYTYWDGSARKTQTLQQYLKAKNMDLALKSFFAIYTIAIDLEDGIVQVKVLTTSPDLSQQVASELIKQLDTFNRTKRRTRATVNLEFIEKRTEVIRSELTQADSALTTFEVRNRNFTTQLSPELTRVYERLKREREVKSSALSLLTEQGELARIEANKDIPIVSMLDPASLPVQKAGPKRTLITLGSLIFALSLGLFIIVVRERYLSGLATDGRPLRLRDLRASLMRSATPDASARDSAGGA